MPGAETQKQPTSERDRLRAEWISRITDLVALIETWGRELGWETRRIDKQAKDLEFGTYQIPALLLQKELTKILLEPVASAAPGAEGGVVDLYLMPGLDDIASLYFYHGSWQIHYMFPDRQAVANIQEAEAKPLSKDSFREVIEEMTRHAA
jgi:hypothetical protein